MIWLNIQTALQHWLCIWYSWLCSKIALWNSTDASRVILRGLLNGSLFIRIYNATYVLLRSDSLDDWLLRQGEDLLLWWRYFLFLLVSIVWKLLLWWLSGTFYWRGALHTLRNIAKVIAFVWLFTFPYNHLAQCLIMRVYWVGSAEHLQRVAQDILVTNSGIDLGNIVNWDMTPNWFDLVFHGASRYWTFFWNSLVFLVNEVTSFYSSRARFEFRVLFRNNFPTLVVCILIPLLVLHRGRIRWE